MVYYPTSYYYKVSYKKPKLKASQDLKRISAYLGKVNQKRFNLLLNVGIKDMKVLLMKKHTILILIDGTLHIKD
jgi:hypothetical protein